MSFYAPRWAFAAQAIDGQGDSHLADGAHLRLFFSQKLGLPILPFDVYRVDLGELAKGTASRTDIVWRDSLGKTLTAPFNVTPDNPVTGWLPSTAHGTCCWIEVDAVPTVIISAGESPVLPSRVDVKPSVAQVTPIAHTIKPSPELLPSDVIIVRPPLLRGSLRVDAVVATPRGPGIVASRSISPYVLSASHIDRVVVTGQGVVRGVRWMDSRILIPNQLKVWRKLALPLERGERYLGLAGAEGLAKDRVARGAPLRETLMDSPTAANAASAPAIATPANTEWARVDARRPPVMAHLRRLVNDTSKPAFQLSDAQDVLDERGKCVGSFEINLLASILNSSLDPGMARLLGFADRDETAAGAPKNSVIAYLVCGYWDSKAAWIDLLNRSLLPPDAMVPAEKLGRDLPKSPHGGQVLTLATLACVTMGAAPSRPLAPNPGTPELGPWVPMTPPDAQREIRLPATGLNPCTMVALARRETTSVVGLNEPAPDGRHYPLVPSVPKQAVNPSAGIFYDRMAPAPALTYRLAQSDWFGRWSDWAEVGAAAGTRPNPPTPVPQLFYVPPTVGTPIPTGLLAGTAKIRVPVPTLASMAPGALPLKSLQVTLNGVTTNHAITVGPGTDCEVLLPGPGLPLCGLGKLTFSARWQDTSSALSAASPALTRDIADPRPPQDVTLPSTLQYGSRPDVTGKSRIDLRWTATPQQRRFRVFLSDETTLVTRLERMVERNETGKTTAQSILAAVAAATNPADRGAVFLSHKAFFTRDMFELLTGDPLESPGFVHQVSGSLRVLLFFRVVAVSDSNVESSFVDGAMVPCAVPNSGAPATPNLVVQRDPDNPMAAQLTIRVPAGTVAATEFRIRRSMSTSGDVLAMPMVTTGVVPAATLSPSSVGEPLMQTAEFLDTGTSELQPTGNLRNWNLYSWRVEVRGAAEPGGGPNGEWSLPSPPANLTLVPAAPPLTATAVTMGVVAGDVEIRCEHPSTLAGGSVGAYQLDLYQHLPNGLERFAQSICADAPVSAGGRNPDRTGRFLFKVTGPIPTGTRFRIIVIDPMGRTSLPSLSVTAP
jgi:hypothetical protein